jgi:V8-like Glu-specific endopeptidase
MFIEKDEPTHMFPIRPPHVALRNGAIRWYVWLPLAVMHLTCCGVAFSQDKSVSVETIERARYAAVPIVCIVAKPDGSVTLNGTVGSAFFVNDEGSFITAAHVLAAIDERAKGGIICNPGIYLPKGGWSANQGKPDFQGFGFSECLQNVPLDIATCRPKENPFQNPIVKNEVRFMTFAAFSSYADGTAVAFTGFPLNLAHPVTSKGYVASFLHTEPPFIMIDKTAWPGASGSPLYLANGTVIGMVVKRGTDDSSGLAFARPVEIITDFLTKNKIAFPHQKQKT